jgi:hypothetical protein
MRTGRPKAILTLSSDERTRLLAITRSRSPPAALTLRAKIVLAGLCGEPAEEKAHRGAVRLGQDDRRTCAAHASGRREARLQVHPDDGRLQSDPPTKTHRSPSMSGNRTSETRNPSITFN